MEYREWQKVKTCAGLRRVVLHLLLGVALFLPIAGLRAATLRTVDGTLHEGLVRFDRGGALLVTPVGAAAVKVRPDDVLDAILRPLQQQTIARGVVLTDGTCIGGKIEAVDAEAVRIRRERSLVVPIALVARVVFQPASDELIARTPHRVSGVLLSNGDFFEGQPRGLDGRALKMESVLFGAASIDIEQQAVVLLLREVKAVTATNVVVRLADGSLLSGERFDIDANGLRIDVKGAGPVSVPEKDVAEIHGGGERQESLLELEPLVEGGESARALSVDRTPFGLPLRVSGMQWQRAITLSGGAAVSYALAGRYALFTCRAAVPASVPPLARARFVVLVDGRELYRSPEQTSIDDPLALSVSVA